ncbi:hypothetical protein [Novosphingobium sp. Rr 2-17]|uniref:hypothetical protein n=1 Tax=Novosphingobium sp. Rr 2-17 TaxID=555793 RepID=UPI0012F6D573|nr:hypothetical protein [Novosphingobium sp. Rr 2-17]
MPDTGNLKLTNRAHQQNGMGGAVMRVIQGVALALWMANWLISGVQNAHAAVSASGFFAAFPF